MPDPSPRSRWQFTLRTLLFVLLCIGGMLAGFQFGYYRGAWQRRNETMSTKVYQVGDLVQRESASGPDFTSIIDLLTSVIDAQSWSDVGGPGDVAGTEDPPTLVIAQTGANHDAIAALFADLRAAKANAGKPGPQKLFLRVSKASEHLGHSTAEAGSNVHPAWYDGCRCWSLLTSDEVMIWWINNEIRDTPFR